MLAALPTASDPSAAGGLSDWIVSVMEAIGAPGAGLIVALENLFPPIPSEVVLPLAGFTASRGEFTLLGAIFWTTLGSVVGAWILYLLGAWLGLERTRALVRKVPFMSGDDVDKVHVWFDKHGYKAVFLGRMIPLFRSLVSIPAGINRMPMLPFLGLTLAGSLVWNSVLILAGYFLGANWHIVEQYTGVFQGVVIAACLLLAFVFIARKVRNSRRSVSS